MNVLVIGATGVIGTATCRTLVMSGHQVFAIALCSPAAELGSQLGGAAIVNRRDPKAFQSAVAGLAPAHGFDAVVDLVAYLPSDVEPIAELPSCRNAHFLAISTTYLYDERAVMPYTPASPLAPITRLGGYCAGKAEVERTYAALSIDLGFPLTIVRIPHVLGGERELGIAPLHARDPDLLGRMIKQWPLLLVDDGQYLAQAVHKDDVATCISCMMGQSAAFGATFNFAFPDPFVVGEYYTAVASAIGVRPILRGIPSRVFCQSQWGWARAGVARVVDCSDAFNLLGRSPERPPYVIAREWASELARRSRPEDVRVEDPLAGVVRALELDDQSLLAALDRAAAARVRSSVDIRMNAPPLPLLV